MLLEYFEKELEYRTGIHFDSYNPDYLLNRIRERMLKLGVEDQEDYLAEIRTDQDEADALLRSIGLNVSEFFRDSFTYETLEKQIVPGVLWQKAGDGVKELRIWSAGCASGEEPYSLAILLDRLLRRQLEEWQINIFATDINSENLSAARSGVYDVERLQEVKLGVLQEYFEPAGERYRIKDQIRNMVNFSLEDITTTKRYAPAESIFGSFDLILCRNVLIYFNSKARERTLNTLARALSTGGYLVLGGSEWMNAESAKLFTRMDKRNRIFVKVP